MKKNTNNNPSGIYPDDILAAIRTRKAEVKKQLQESATYIKTTTRKMFTPPQATNKFESLMNMMDQGVMVYDGLMMGMRFARNIRRLFGRRRR